MKSMSSMITVLLLFSANCFAQQTTGVINYQFVDQLTSPITGVVRSVAEIEKRYSAGSRLIEFDSTVIDSKMKSLQQAKDKRQKVLAEAQRELQRSMDLYEGTMLSDHELKLAEIKVSEAKEDLAEVEHKLTKLRWKKQFYLLKAPYDGYLLKSNLYSGKYVANRFMAEPIIEFLQADSVQFSISTNQTSLPVIGSEVGFSSKGAAFKGKIMAIIERKGEKVIYTKLISRPDSLPRQGSIVNIEFN